MSTYSEDAEEALKGMEVSSMLDEQRLLYAQVKATLAVSAEIEALRRQLGDGPTERQRR